MTVTRSTRGSRKLSPDRCGTKQVYVAKGHREHDYDGSAEVHIAGMGGKRCKASVRKRLCRITIEPKIGHAKHAEQMACSHCGADNPC